MNISLEELNFNLACAIFAYSLMNLIVFHIVNISKLKNFMVKVL